MYTLLDNCVEHIKLDEFVGPLVIGLSDVPEVKTICALILMRLAKIFTINMAPHNDKFLDPIKIVLGQTPKENAVKMEVEKHQELIQTMIKTVAYLRFYVGNRSSVQLETFISGIIQPNKAYDENFKAYIASLE
jgi:hypothetical protein